MTMTTTIMVTMMRHKGIAFRTMLRSWKTMTTILNKKMSKSSRPKPKTPIQTGKARMKITLTEKNLSLLIKMMINTWSFSTKYLKKRRRNFSFMTLSMEKMNFQTKKE